MNTLYISNRKDWRKWLKKNHDKEKDIWLVYYRNIQKNYLSLIMIQLKRRSVLAGLTVLSNGLTMSGMPANLHRVSISPNGLCQTKKD